MNALQPSRQNMAGIFGMRTAMRLALAALLGITLLALALPARSASAATVGDCATVTHLGDSAWGKIRWAGMSQCYSLYLDEGYMYTFTVDAGDRYYTSSSNVYDPLGDSVLTLYRDTTGRVQVNDPFNAAYFETVGVNDDYAPSVHRGSRLTVDLSAGSGRANPRSTLYVARVSGYATAVGTYSITVTRAAVADLGSCDSYFSCR
jgi:hypothetical protein